MNFERLIPPLIVAALAVFTLAHLPAAWRAVTGATTTVVRWIEPSAPSTPPAPSMWTSADCNFDSLIPPDGDPIAGEIVEEAYLKDKAKADHKSFCAEVQAEMKHRAEAIRKCSNGPAAQLTHCLSKNGVSSTRLERQLWRGQMDAH